MIKKTECIDYYVDENGWVLDLDKRFIYCQWHFSTRLREDENGFIVCEECNNIIKKGEIIK